MSEKGYVSEGKKRMSMVKPAGETNAYEEGATNEGEQPSNDTNDGEGVLVSPEFQQHIHKLVKGANKHELNHARDRISERQDELRKAEYEAEKKNHKAKDGDSIISTEGMPVD